MLLGIECPALAKEKDSEDEQSDEVWPAASHLQVTMLRGVAWHWKQLCAYEFTGMKLPNCVTFCAALMKCYRFRNLCLVFQATASTAASYGYTIKT